MMPMRLWLVIALIALTALLCGSIAALQLMTLSDAHKREKERLETLVASLIAENTRLKLHGDKALRDEYDALETALRDMGVNMSNYRVEVSSGKCEVVRTK